MKTKDKQRKICGPARLVNVGVDTFVINGAFQDGGGKPVKRELNTEFVERLEGWKKQSQNRREPCPTDLLFHDRVLHMQPNGAGRGQWQWMLKTSDITLYISRGMWNGIASVRCNSEFLWSCATLTEAVVKVDELFYTTFGEFLLLQPSSIDLCADIAGWVDIVNLDKKRNFVSHSRKRGRHSETEVGEGLKADDYSYGLHETGFDFSSRGPMSLTIYDKTREMKKSGKDWFAELWRLRGWNEEEQPEVWRVEAKFKREVLRELKWREQHGIEDAYQVEELLPVLWAYAVGHVGGGSDGLPDGWLRCVLPSADTNRARWEVHPAWIVVQGAFSQGMEVPPYFGEIIRKAKEERNVRKGLEAVLGYASTLSAWIGGDLADGSADLTIFLHWLAENGEGLLEEREKDFAMEVLRKRLKFGLPIELSSGRQQEQTA